MTDGDDRSLSRRAVLAGLTSAGAVAAAGAGVGTRAVFRDGERVEGSVGSGVVDLRASWVSGGSDASFGTVRSVGDGGSDAVALSLAPGSNPAYVWARTRCRRCTELERNLRVTLSLVADGTETQLFRGRLGDARATLGDGVRLDGSIAPGDDWRLTVEWELREPLTADATVSVDLDFYAVQTRNVADPETFGPGWTCPTECVDRQPGTADLSWVGFCAAGGERLRPDDLRFAVDGSVLELADAPAALGTVLLKYGTNLDVFERASPGRFVAGSGDTYDQRGPDFPGSGRSNPTPCPGNCGLKYDVDGGGFESDGCDHD
ncbi:hypothetical protein HZS55_06350 [Halosimplex rubrum]|uniref:Uncharacterized protein n=1 Tax=Halosimplex rubrum TaxID=869889 RepID=A0A7D5NZN1_9EURY|nr:hypothetical protein [Halosimplex rubrum]QLH76937.1 hypothetical protein HZS55_06350 [Halosimplex rubrum]